MRFTSNITWASGSIFLGHVSQEAEKGESRESNE